MGKARKGPGGRPVDRNGWRRRGVAVPCRKFDSDFYDFVGWILAGVESLSMGSFGGAAAIRGLCLLV